MKYGDAVQVEYVDLADPGSREEYSGVARLAEERDLLYPLVAVNGNLRVAGSAHYYRVLPLVEEALEVEPAA